MDSTRDILRNQAMTGEKNGEILDPKEITLREIVLNWEYGCSADCKHYKPDFYGDYGCEFEKCPFTEQEFKMWRELRVESKLCMDRRRLRKAYTAIKNDMPWFPDEKEKKVDDG